METSQQNQSVPVKVLRFINVPSQGLMSKDIEDERPRPPCVPTALREVFACLRRGDTEATWEALDAVASAPEDHDYVTAARLFALMLDGEIDQALQLVKGLTDDELQNDEVAVSHAAVLLVSGSVDEALEKLEAVLKKQPLHGLGRYLWSLHRAQTGDLQQAHDKLMELCGDFSDHALARLQLGQVLMAAGDIARAGTLFEAAIDMAPRLVQAWERFAALLVLGGQPGEAMSLARRGLELHPGSRPLLEVLARAALAIGETGIALDATRLVLNKAQDDPVAFANHAVALSSDGQNEAAKVLLKDARERFPQDPGLRQLALEIDVAS